MNEKRINTHAAGLFQPVTSQGTSFSVEYGIDDVFNIRESN